MGDGEIRRCKDFLSVVWKEVEGLEVVLKSMVIKIVYVFNVGVVSIVSDKDVFWWGMVVVKLSGRVLGGLVFKEMEWIREFDNNGVL